jgi:hypothetical protein
LGLGVGIGARVRARVRVRVRVRVKVRLRVGDNCASSRTWRRDDSDNCAVVTSVGTACAWSSLRLG